MKRKQIVKVLLAQRLVMQLHAPQEITLPDGSWGRNCVHCDGWIYPCKTMELISDGMSNV